MGAVAVIITTLMSIIYYLFKKNHKKSCLTLRDAEHDIKWTFINTGNIVMDPYFNDNKAIAGIYTHEPPPVKKYTGECTECGIRFSKEQFLSKDETSLIKHALLIYKPKEKKK